MLARALTSSSIEVFWQPPSTYNGNLLYYNVSWYPSDGKLTQEDDLSTDALLTFLEPCQRYYVSVTATTQLDNDEEETSFPSESDDAVTFAERKLSELSLSTLLIYFFYIQSYFVILAENF